jgi:hypothetical protein
MSRLLCKLCISLKIHISARVFSPSPHIFIQFWRTFFCGLKGFLNPRWSNTIVQVQATFCSGSAIKNNLNLNFLNFVYSVADCCFFLFSSTSEEQVWTGFHTLNTTYRNRYQYCTFNITKHFVAPSVLQFYFFSSTKYLSL